MGRNGNAPDALATTNSNGVPVVGLVVAFVLGPDRVPAVPQLAAAGRLHHLGDRAVLRRRTTRRRRAPAYRPSLERPFRVPGGDVIPLLAFVSSNLIVIWAGWTVNWKLFVTVLLGLLLLGVQETVRKRNPPLEFRAGMWMVVWLGGLAILSFFAGDLDDQARMGFWTGVVLTAIFSVAIYYFAVGSRLPEETMREHMETVGKEAAMEDEALGSID